VSKLLLNIFSESKQRLFNVICQGGFCGVRKEEKAKSGKQTHFQHTCSIVREKKKELKNKGLKHCMTDTSMCITRFLEFPPSIIRALWFHYRLAGGKSAVAWEYK
jgi:hypothetical protein